MNIQFIREISYHFDECVFGFVPDKLESVWKGTIKPVDAAYHTVEFAAATEPTLDSAELLYSAWIADRVRQP